MAQELLHPEQVTQERAGQKPWCLLEPNVGSHRGSPGGSVVKNPPANAGDAEMQVRSLGQEDPLEEGMATHSSILAWRIP